MQQIDDERQIFIDELIAHIKKLGWVVCVPTDFVTTGIIIGTPSFISDVKKNAPDLDLDLYTFDSDQNNLM